ncbi:MAG TPA: Type 1 glutamine amidotransferase-like domain-containing protein, partial [Ignavibacteriaceae bacterium]|nr:Type 1 glutamine amidotransferase-like domain-containing protein [Ignavibacteriaceae bacterium]
WLPTYFMSLGADTAYNKTISSQTIADLPETYDEIISAKAVFIRGGDQWDYIRLWKGTKTDSAIQYVFNNGGVIAGTSAGAAVLGDVDFSGQSGSAYSDDALLNPFYSRMKFESNFLNFIPNVLFDTHFTERGRQGRLIAMLYNQHFNASKDLIGAGIDDRTAICISPDGIGEVMGSGAVSIFYKDDFTEYSDYTSGKYTIEKLRCHTLTKGWKYDFINNQIAFIPASAKDVDINSPWFYSQTDITLTGSNNISAQLNNLGVFLNEVNSTKVLLITHPGFSSSASIITDYLSSNSFIYDVLNITTGNLNDASEAVKLNEATCFIFAGDSLNVLSYLNQPVGLVNAAFYNQTAMNIPIFFFGNAGKIAGNFYIGNTDTDMYASYRGKMTINEGLFIFADLIFQPLLYDNSDFYENRTSSVLWGLMRKRRRIGIYLNENDRLNIKSSSFENSISGTVLIPYMIVDARETDKVDSSTYRASGSIGPRQIVAMNNLRISLTNYSNINYLLETGKFDYLTNVENENVSQLTPFEFKLNQNYPNPFNPSTTIRWRQSKPEKITIKLFDILGNEIETLVDDYYESGSHSKFYTMNSKLSSGIYFYRLSTKDFSETKSMVFLK